MWRYAIARRVALALLRPETGAGGRTVRRGNQEITTVSARSAGAAEAMRAMARGGAV